MVRVEFQEALTEREEAQTVVRGALTAVSVFCALQKVYRKRKEVMQAAEDRWYLKVYATGELVELDMEGWYGHLKGE